MRQTSVAKSFSERGASYIDAKFETKTGKGR